MGVSKLRFLPKSNKVRPIVNLGSKVQLPAMYYGRGKKAESVNRQLQDVFHVLNYEKVNLECLGRGLTQWEEFVARNMLVQEFLSIVLDQSPSVLLWGVSFQS